MFNKFVTYIFVLSIGIANVANAQTPPTPAVANNPSDAGVRAFAPLYLSANELSIATGQPSLVTMSTGGAFIPVWSLSGGTVGQSVVGLVPRLPDGCAGVKVEIVVTSDDPQTSPDFSDVYRVTLSQMVPETSFSSNRVTCDPVPTALPAEPFFTRTIVLESFYEVKSNAPLSVRIHREPDDLADTFVRPTGLAAVIVTPLTAPAKALVVEGSKGYNSWPMIQAIGDKLVCMYSRGTAHSINEDVRAVYARTSTDNGKTWTPETVVANTPGDGEVTIGKGLDSKGALLLWVRRIGKSGFHHDLYKSTDGVTFTHVCTPELDVMPMQITDIIAVPTVGLIALWFEGNYGDNGPCHSWGLVVSKDDGATWTQKTIESKLNKEDWPTEQSAVYLGDGKILAIARTEMGGPTTVQSQFQLTSTDYGATWTRAKTNITDVVASTPSLIFDSETGLLSNYYFHRGRGVVRRRVVKPEDIFNHPMAWPASEAVALGSSMTYHAGNANATVIQGVHFPSFYSGDSKDTIVVTAAVAAPKAANIGEASLETK